MKQPVFPSAAIKMNIANQMQRVKIRFRKWRCLGILSFWQWRSFLVGVVFQNFEKPTFDSTLYRRKMQKTQGLIDILKSNTETEISISKSI